MIDTLKLARRLGTAGMPQSQAEALAEGLGSELREPVASKADLDALFWKITATLAVMLAAHLVAVWRMLP
jgi:hypothetical protein